MGVTDPKLDDVKQILKDIDLVKEYTKLGQGISTALVKIREDVNLLKKENDHTVIKSVGHGVFLGFKTFLLVCLLKWIITH